MRYLHGGTSASSHHVLTEKLYIATRAMLRCDEAGGPPTAEDIEVGSHSESHLLECNLTRSV